MKKCTMCEYVGKEKTHTKGSIVIELILWIFFIIPGLVYSIWRLTSREKVCPNCGHNSMIPIRG